MSGEANDHQASFLLSHAFSRHAGDSEENKRNQNRAKATLFSKPDEDQKQQYGLLGKVLGVSPPQAVFLSTKSPFTSVLVGVQGGGKSHTLCTVLENCLINTPVAHGARLIKVNPMLALVLHYDQNQSEICEATGLVEPSARPIFGFESLRLAPANLVVLLSPSNYRERRDLYARKGCQVFPLLFKWDSLDAPQLNALMRVDESQGQLYMSKLFDDLRSAQRDGKKMTYEEFRANLKNKGTKDEPSLAPGQSGPLMQRVNILDNMLTDSECNKDLEWKDLKDVFVAGNMVICDLTDSYMSQKDANAVFHVVLEQFKHHVPFQTRKKEEKKNYY